MTGSTLLQHFITPVLTAVLTLAGTHWQLASQNQRADRERFIDAAQATAQDTSRLLLDGYAALHTLVNESDNKGWEEFSRTSWTRYRDFHRQWRQQLIVQHFKLARHFGKDVADQLVHVDEIDLHPSGASRADRPCVPAGGADAFDVAKLASQIDCMTRLITVSQDAIDSALAADAGAPWTELARDQRETIDLTWQLLAQYDKASVGYLRTLNDRLTQLGEPEVTVIRRADDR